ncbi:MAG: diacylglycerol/polyprenol kinase family protein, partial [Vicinamibacteria bacterium]
MSSAVTAVLFAAGVGGLVALAELFRRRFAINSHYTRKFVHIATGLLTVAAPAFFPSREPVLVVTGLFLLVLPVAIHFRWLPGIHDVEGGPYGTFCFGLSFLLLAALCWENPMRPALYVGMMVLTWGDSLAGLIGKSFGRRRFRIGRSMKSLEGTGAMFVGSFVAAAATLGALGYAPFTELLGLSLLVAVIATAVEMVTPGAFDNLTVPLAAAFVIQLLASSGPEGDKAFAIGVGLSLGFALLALAANFLEFTGAVTSVILGSI